MFCRGFGSPSLTHGGNYSFRIGARSPCVNNRVSHFQKTGLKCLLFHTDAGPFHNIRGIVCGAAGLYGRNQRYNQFQDHLWFPAVRFLHKGDSLLCCIGISDTGLSVLPVDCAKPAWKSVDCHKGQRKPGKIFRIQSGNIQNLCLLYFCRTGRIGRSFIRSSGGIISPAEMGIVPSVEMVIWVAIGGRGTLVGSVIGAIL